MVEAQNSSRGSLSLGKLFAVQQTVKLSVSSWNVGGITPPHNLSLDDLLNTQNGMADIYVFGFQEIVPLTAGNIFRSENGDISTKWNAVIKEGLNKRNATEGVAQKNDVGENFPGDNSHAPSVSVFLKEPLSFKRIRSMSRPEFECVISKQMVGIYITVWVRTELSAYISYPSVSCVGCGLLGRQGNKGAVSVRFFLWETSFCFVCSHLASGGREGHVKQRNEDAARILSHTDFPSSPLQTLPRNIIDHDRVVWLGDLNYRINLPEATTRSLVNNKEWGILLQNDQLKAELSKGHVFEGWHEEEINFAPTYKYNQDSDDYYGCNQKMKKKKRRAPAWCDRIIWFGKGLKQLRYGRSESRLSDHRPVHAIFRAQVEVVSSKEPDSDKIG